MRFSVRLLAAVAVLGLSSAAFAELVDNPAYQNWAKYKPGTSVTFKSTLEMTLRPGVTMEYTTTEKLVEVKPDMLTVETTIVVTSPAQPNETKRTATEAAKVDKGQEYLVPLYAGASDSDGGMNTKYEVKDVKEGKDKVNVKGADVDAATREFIMISSRISPPPTTSPTVSGIISTNVKTWTVAQVPGGIAKLEWNYPLAGGTMKCTSVLVDFTVAK